MLENTEGAIQNGQSRETGNICNKVKKTTPKTPLQYEKINTDNVYKT